MLNDDVRDVYSHFSKERVQVLLRGGTTLSGIIHLPEGMPLVNYLRIRRLFLNLTSVEEEGIEGPMDHLSVRLSHVVWVIPESPSLQVAKATTPAESARTLELQLVDGLVLTVQLNMAEAQRMSDFLDGDLGFLPLLDAHIQPVDHQIERLAVNHEAILAIREVGGR
jgi:hypothetical protein